VSQYVDMQLYSAPKNRCQPKVQIFT